MLLVSDEQLILIVSGNCSKILYYSCLSANRCAGMSSAHHCFSLQQNMTDNTTTQGNSWVETHNIFLVEKEADEAMEYLIG